MSVLALPCCSAQTADCRYLGAYRDSPRTAPRNTASGWNFARSSNSAATPFPTFVQSHHEPGSRRIQGSTSLPSTGEQRRTGRRKLDQADGCVSLGSACSGADQYTAHARCDAVRERSENSGSICDCAVHSNGERDGYRVMVASAGHEYEMTFPPTSVTLPTAVHEAALGVLGHHVGDSRLIGGRPPRAEWGRSVL